MCPHGNGVAQNSKMAINSWWMWRWRLLVKTSWRKRLRNPDSYVEQKSVFVAPCDELVQYQLPFVPMVSHPHPTLKLCLHVSRSMNRRLPCWSKQPRSNRSLLLADNSAGIWDDNLTWFRYMSTHHSAVWPCWAKHILGGRDASSPLSQVLVCFTWNRNLSFWKLCTYVF